MTRTLAALAVVSAMTLGQQAPAQNLLLNSAFDATVEISGQQRPGAPWVIDSSRAISGPFDDGLSSEPWAGPAPTPVTFGSSDGDDRGVFFKPFTGNATDGATTSHVYQDVTATPGLKYVLTGWAGAEVNAQMADAVLAIDFLDGGGNAIAASGAELSLLPTLQVDNGEAFDYKQYMVMATAPAGAVNVRARASMIGATANPAGGGQAFVIDDFSLTAVPEPAALSLAALALLGLMARRRP